MKRTILLGHVLKETAYFYFAMKNHYSILYSSSQPFKKVSLRNIWMSLHSALLSYPSLSKMALFFLWHRSAPLGYSLWGASRERGEEWDTNDSNPRSTWLLLLCTTSSLPQFPSITGFHLLWPLPRGIFHCVHHQSFPHAIQGKHCGGFWTEKNAIFTDKTIAGEFGLEMWV